MINESDLLKTLGQHLRQARESAGMTQERTADLAGVSRQRYRDIETGGAAARATTLVNIARALGMEMMLIPQRLVPAVNAIIRPAADDDDDRPAFEPEPDADEEDHTYGRGMR